EHPFAWTGVPPEIEQGGHSGAPLVRDGAVFAIFSGTKTNGYACRLVTGKRWPQKLRFASVFAIRAQARAVGFEL
ncbi:MAG TPA: hypothetical protein VF103_07695, partial [Polyangiaceae bacterium]